MSRPNDPATVTAKLTFVLDTGEKPINYPSEAGGRTEIDTGVADERSVMVRNARMAGEPFSLDCQGFTLVEHVSRVGDYYDDEQITSIHTLEAAALVKRATNAREAVVFDHTRRSDDVGLKITRRVRDPSRTVHNDYTPASAQQRLRDFLGARANGMIQRRFAIVNVWRSMSGPILRSPLALCDARSVSSADLIVTERRAKDRIGETYRIVFNERQRWYYYPQMQVDEVILLKTFDSAADGRARFAPHSAFVDSGTPRGASPRESIETRAFALF